MEEKVTIAFRFDNLWPPLKQSEVRAPALHEESQGTLALPGLYVCYFPICGDPAATCICLKNSEVDVLILWLKGTFFP